MPILRQLSGGTRQNRRCQSFHANPRQDEKATVVDDVLQIACALIPIPPDPAISVRHFPCGTGPEKTSQDLAAAGFDKVTQVSTDGSAIAEIVIALNQLTEQGTVRCIRQPEAQRFKFSDTGLNGTASIAKN